MFDGTARFGGTNSNFGVKQGSGVAHHAGVDETVGPVVEPAVGRERQVAPLVGPNESVGETRQHQAKVPLRSRPGLDRPVVFPLRTFPVHLRAR